MKHPSSRQGSLGDLIQEDTGRHPAEPSSRLHQVARNVTKLLLLSWRGFNADHCPLRASALTLYSLMAIVPVFAMLFGIAKGFGIEPLLQERLLEQFREQQEIAHILFGFAQSLLANTQGGVIAGVGIVLLFVSVLGLIGEIEKSFNHIWKIPTDRTLSRKISDYLSVMLLAPILLIASSSIAVYAQDRIAEIAPHLPAFSSAVLQSLFSSLPLLIVWVLFSFTIIFMPNTKVALKSGIIAGILSGTVFQLTKWAYVQVQIGVSNYNAIYGSFAALPLFIISLQAGWLILLFGAELAFYHQHRTSYRTPHISDTASFAQNKITALRIAHLLVHKFAAAEPPLTAGEIARTLHIPITQVRGIINILLRNHIVAAVKYNGDVIAYQPACDIGLLRITTIIETLENDGEKTVLANPENDRLQETVTLFAETLRNSPGNRLLKDI